MTHSTCPRCDAPRHDLSRACASCGAPALAEHRQAPPDGAVREEDLQPCVALRYITRLFKVLAALIVVMLLGEVALGVAIDGCWSINTLLGEATRLLVLAGLLWAAGDIAALLVDAGHDLRVTRILLGRIDSRLQGAPGAPAARTPAAGEEPAGGAPDRAPR